MSDSAKHIATVEGSPKAWAQVNSSAVIQGSFNISSVTDNGTGLFDYNFSNNMANEEYFFSGNSNNAGGIPTICFVTATLNLLVGSANTRNVRSGTTTFQDTDQTISIIGELA